jgi:hypothetical protein
LDGRVGDGESAGRNRVDSCVVDDFEAWTRVGSGVGGVGAKVMGIALTNEDVGGVTIRSEGEVVAEDGEDAVSVVGVIVRVRRWSGGVVGGRSCGRGCSWVVCVGIRSWVSCNWGSCS